jgi:replication initiation protein RepC
MLQSAIRADGVRRLTLAMRAETIKADGFAGLPRGTAKPFEILATFEQALPYLNLPSKTFLLVSFLVDLTRAIDWEETSRPIAWPSNDRLIELLGVSRQRLKALIRELCEAGMLVMRDSPTGKRFGRRDADGRIAEAYGFDLSRLAQREAEFKQIAADAAIERNRKKELRKCTTQLKRCVAQTVDELDRQGDDRAALEELVRDAAALVKAAAACRSSDALAPVVEALERLKAAADARLERYQKPPKNAREGQQNLPHIEDTNLTIFKIVDTTEPSKRSDVEPIATPRPQETLEITPRELVAIAPRIAPYLATDCGPQAWPALVDAAYWLAAELGINRTLWARACELMGRYDTAVAVAIVSTRPTSYFTSGPGGYFAGMVRKFENNPADLRLSATIRKLKRGAPEIVTRRNDPERLV